MDIQLPHISGLELIEALKKDSTLASVPIMAVTAYAGKGDEDRIRAAGAEAYVSKPISVMKFIETVEELRSEEHTSELQSLMRNSYAVFCLKKKNKINT